MRETDVYLPEYYCSVTMVDWLVFNANISNISAISWCLFSHEFFLDFRDTNSNGCIKLYLKLYNSKLINTLQISWNIKYIQICIKKKHLITCTCIYKLQGHSSKYSQTCPCGHLYLAATCIKRSPFSCPVIDNFIWIEPLLRGHLSYKATFSLSNRWPLNSGLIVHAMYIIIIHQGVIAVGLM